MPATMTEAAQRAAVVTEVLSWQGTRYHHAAMVKIRRGPAGEVLDRGGVDCCTLLVAVYRSVGLIDPVEIPHYPADWHLHRKSERYMAAVLERARPIEQHDAGSGDVVMFRFGHAYSHAGIIVAPGWPAMVHAFFGSGSVQQDRGDGGAWGSRPRRFFSLWDG